MLAELRLRRPWHTLPRRFYGDSDFHELDFENIWRQQDLSAACQAVSVTERQAMGAAPETIAAAALAETLIGGPMGAPAGSFSPGWSAFH